MNPILHFLFGKLAATVDALKVEGKHLIEEDEDTHKRLDKLIKQLESITAEMGAAELVPSKG